MYLNCLKYAIGLSQTTCTCYENSTYFGTDKPTDFNKSESGLFLDQTPGLKLEIINAAGDCADGSLWELMEQAREEGIKQYVQLLLSGLMTHSRQRIEPFNGCIGGIEFTKTLVYSGAYGGIKVKTNNQRG